MYSNWEGWPLPSLGHNLHTKRVMISLVVVVVDEGQGEREQHTNESLWLVGGCGGWWMTGRVTMTHQQVIVTRWWLWQLTRGGNGVFNLLVLQNKLCMIFVTKCIHFILIYFYLLATQIWWLRTRLQASKFEACDGLMLPSAQLGFRLQAEPQQHYLWWGRQVGG